MSVKDVASMPSSEQIVTRRSHLGSSHLVASNSTATQCCYSICGRKSKYFQPTRSMPLCRLRLRDRFTTTSNYADGTALQRLRRRATLTQHIAGLASLVALGTEIDPNADQCRDSKLSTVEKPVWFGHFVSSPAQSISRCHGQ